MAGDRRVVAISFMSVVTLLVSLTLSPGHRGSHTHTSVVFVSRGQFLDDQRSTSSLMYRRRPCVSAMLLSHVQSSVLKLIEVL